MSNVAAEHDEKNCLYFDSRAQNFWIDSALECNDDAKTDAARFQFTFHVSACVVRFLIYVLVLVEVANFHMHSNIALHWVYCCSIHLLRFRFISAQCSPTTNRNFSTRLRLPGEKPLRFIVLLLPKSYRRDSGATQVQLRLRFATAAVTVAIERRPAYFYFRLICKHVQQTALS